MYIVVSIVDNEDMDIAKLIAYLRFLMVHGCCWCSDLVCSCYSCCDSGSRQCFSLVFCTKCYYMQVI